MTPAPPRVGAPKRWRLRLRAALGALCLALALGAPAGAAPKAVSVAIMPDGQGAFRVSVVYPGEAGKQRGMAEAADLWKRSALSPRAAQWFNVPAVKGFPAQSSLEFTVDTLYPGGVFPAEAFALAYRKWGGVDITVSPSGAFQYRGPAHTETADAVVDVAAHGNALTVSVHVRNPKVERLQLTPVVAAPPIQPQRRSVPMLGLVCLALGAGGAVWLIVYAVMSARKEKGAEAGAALPGPDEAPVERKPE